MTTDEITRAVHAVLATYDAGDALDMPMLALKLAVSEADRARFRDEANRYWLECSALRAQLDDAERRAYDAGAGVDMFRDRIAELEQMVGEREGRIGGLEYDVGELTATIAAQRARIAELEAQAAGATVVMPGARTAKHAGACPHCGKPAAKGQHIVFCPKNPDRKEPAGAILARRRREAAAAPEAPAPAPDPAPVVMGARYCRFCRAPFSPKGTALEQHEPRCPENPSRMAPPDLVRAITLSVDSSERYECPECKGTAFAKALRADRCVNCDNKARIEQVAA